MELKFPGTNKIPRSSKNTLFFYKIYIIFKDFLNVLTATTIYELIKHRHHKNKMITSVEKEFIPTRLHQKVKIQLNFLIKLSDGIKRIKIHILVKERERPKAKRILDKLFFYKPYMRSIDSSVHFGASKDVLN